VITKTKEHVNKQQQQQQQMIQKTYVYHSLNIRFQDYFVFPDPIVYLND
jgi:hypothetical protein